MYNQLKKWTPYIFLSGIALYILSIIVFNYNSKAFYNFDMYADTIIAKMIAEQQNLFPDSFVFGNQFYVVATPVLAALLYTFINDSFISLITASCIMMIFTIAAFLYCFDYKSLKKTIIYGLFCMIGGTIVGTGACSYMNGLQVFYTMASYYSCYLIGMLLTFGVYFRLKNQKHCNTIWIFIIIAYNFALNMHSLRQMLVCCIPLMCFEVLSVFTMLLKGNKILSVLKNNKKTLVFVFLILSSAVCGIIFIKNFKILQTTIIEDISLELVPHELYLNFKNTVSEFCEYIGLLYYQKGIKYFPLVTFALFGIMIVSVALIIMLKNRDNSLPACMAYISMISLCGVFFVGIFLMEVRSIYFFVWYLLIASCVIYLSEKLRGNIKYMFLAALLFVGAGNYVYNFGFDAIEYATKHSAFEQLAEKIEELNVETAYLIDSVPHTIGIYLDENTTVATVDTDYKMQSGYPFIPQSYLQKKDIFNNVDYNNCILILDNKFWDVAEKNGGEEYSQHLLAKLDLCYSHEIKNDRIYYVYKIKDPVFNERILTGESEE